MKTKLYIICLLLVLVFCSADLTNAQKPDAKKPTTAQASMLKTDKEELEAAVALPPTERIEKLNAFISARPRSALRTRAMELIVSAHAALGEEKLTSGDVTGGTDQFRLAVAAIPTEMSAKLFKDVVFQIPSNLYLRGQPTVALEVARLIEDRVKSDPIHLMEMAAFYLGIEAADDALRAAELAVKLAPTMSASYQARASALRMSLRLNDAAADYARALELDPKSDNARRSLADLSRATGKTEEALTLYRELLTGDSSDEFARAGLVVSLFELGRKDEAEGELDAAMKASPTSLALLAGVAYWFAAHDQGERAIQFAEKAVQVEPRYTWGDIALARGLLLQKRASEAETPLLIARQYGKFPTLDYEMASVLVAIGFYGEAASTLSTSFAVKQDLIETFLAGRIHAEGSGFTELLAPERRASIFQFTAADNETSARSLKALLAFSTLLSSPGDHKESDLRAAAREFVSGDDDMRAFRRIYVASRLLEKNFAYPLVLEMMDAVTSDVESALKASAASTAVMAEELRDARVKANAYGRTISVPGIPRNVLSNIIRGRIEDLAGWALFNQGKYAESVVRLRRATSVLPEKSVWWRDNLWHLGASLDATNKGNEALEAYYTSYNSGGPDPTRRAVIERLYRKVHGSLGGLEDKIGPPLELVLNPDPSADTSQLRQTSGAESSPPSATVETTLTEVSPKLNAPSEQKPVSPESTPLENPPANDESSEQKVDKTEAEPVVDAPKIDTTSEQKSVAMESNQVETAPTPEPTPESERIEVPPGPPQPAVNDEPPADQNVVISTTETRPPPSTNESSSQRPRRVVERKCAIRVSESALTIQNNGGRAVIDVTLDSSASATGVTASTSDWSSLAVFPEPTTGTVTNSASFSVTSISKKTGTFTVTFKTSCGPKEVIVTVR